MRQKQPKYKRYVTGQVGFCISFFGPKRDLNPQLRNAVDSNAVELFLNIYVQLHSVYTTRTHSLISYNFGDI
jgi:hypothetical protein